MAATQEENLIEDPDEKHEELIAEVKKRKVLYDRGSSSTRNKYLRELAWSEVAKAVAKQELWCKTEWGKFRSAYQRKKKALIGKTGQARKKIEAWCHFQSLQFLNEHEAPASTSGNMKPIVDLDVDQMFNSVEGSFVEVVVEEPHGIEDVTEVDSVVQGPGTSAVAKERSEKDVTYSGRRHQKRCMDPVDEELTNFLKRPKEAQDEHDYFAMGVAEQLRKMSAEVSSLARMQIQQVLHKSLFPDSSI